MLLCCKETVVKRRKKETIKERWIDREEGRRSEKEKERRTNRTIKKLALRIRFNFFYPWM